MWTSNLLINIRSFVFTQAAKTIGCAHLSKWRARPIVYAHRRPKRRPQVEEKIAEVVKLIPHEYIQEDGDVPFGFDAWLADARQNWAPNCFQLFGCGVAHMTDVPSLPKTFIIIGGEVLSRNKHCRLCHMCFSFVQVAPVFEDRCVEKHA